jgi:glutaminyl-tRNA synthetase
MAVLDPLKVVLTNYPAGGIEEIDAPLFPHDVPAEGSRLVPFSRELWIERADFEEAPPKGFRRLVPAGEVRLRYAYVIRCDEVVKDESGRVVELRCTYDPKTRGGSTPEGRKVKGTIQWVSVPHALDAEVRLFDRLFSDCDMAVVAEEDAFDPTVYLNPDSLVVVRAKVEPSIASDASDTRYQFERTGYFWRDPVDGVDGELIFNRIVALKDTWARKEVPGAGDAPPAGGAVPSDRNGSQGGERAPSRPSAPTRAGDAARRARQLTPEMVQRFERYRSEFGVIDEHAELLASSPEFFEAALAEHHDATAVASWIVVDLRGLLGDRTLSSLPFGGAAIGRLAALVDSGRISRRAAKDVLARMVEIGGEPEALVAAMGLEKVSDSEALGAIIESVLSGRPDKVAEYRGGKKGLIGFFVGEVMKQTGGAADPAKAKLLLSERLEK